MIFALKLVLAHVLGDFVFQPSHWVEHKQLKTYRSKYLYWHIAIHLCLLLLVFQFNLEYWLGIVVIIFSHFLIDVGKLQLAYKLNPIYLFFIDQFMHVLVLTGVMMYYMPDLIDVSILYSSKSILLLISIILLTLVTSIVIKTVLSNWNIEERSVNKAGKYIGMVERLFIFCFIAFNHWEGIGFLLAARSVFRFGDLSNSKDRNLTEYVLLGTLLSFGIAMLLSLMFNYLIQFS